MYDDTYTSIRALAGSGTSVLVCEPQSVATLVSRRGRALSLMSQTRMPSQ